MKATLATLACLLTAGLLTAAASVDGNNTAVVIRKNVVQSDTGFQFLCVPVNGLDITGENGGTVKLSTMLPPETLTAGTKISLVDSSANVTQEATISSVAGVNTWSTDLDLSGGQIFWLKVGEDAEAANQEASVASLSLFATAGQEEEAVNGETEPIVFCGQDRTRSPITPGLGVLTPMSNDSSVPLKLSEVNANPVNLDTIMTIKSGSSDYELYDYFGGVWYGPMGANCNDVEIAPGEAVYYFKRYN